jgi:NhaA family Na+:H+ antiporter
MQGKTHITSLTPLPPAPVDRLVAPIVRFLHVEATSGLVLLACTIAALVLANSPWSEGFLALWETPLGLRLGSLEMTHALKDWINDGLMAIFFFVIGLEVKRELVLGELRDVRTAALPVAAAAGGMVAPASIYLSLQLGEPGEHGWGIPMATDIAFVVGCMAVLGSRIPRGLRVMLLSLAIADDIGAVLVIAAGYTEQLHVGALLTGVLAIGVVVGLARAGVRSVGVYVLVGTIVWLMFHHSGVHATIAGVILGLLTPAHSWVSESVFSESVRRFGHFLHGEGWPTHGERHLALRHLEWVAREAVPPLERLEAALHPWVSFGIMPLFALANAGVVFQLADFGNPVAVAVMLALVIGKPVGILVLSWLALRLGLARLPEGVGWRALAGGGILSGIGFTMALFIADLAIDGSLLAAAKVGILGGSLLAALLGMTLLAAVPEEQAGGSGGSSGLRESSGQRDRSDGLVAGQEPVP